MQNLCDQLNPGAGDDNYDPQRHPNVVYNLGANVHLMISDPEVAQELLGSKNNIFDKNGINMGWSQKLMGQSFLFSPANESWKAKRKATAHAFYKDRLVNMIECIKDKLGDACQTWVKQMQQSQAASTEVDLSRVFREIFTRNIELT